MPRYRLTLEYDGTPFLGWQIQPDGPSVQGRLVQAFRMLTGTTVDVRGAGRTDSGVHALGQVAHVDLPRAYPVHVIREAINYHARPDPVAILDVAEVPDTFDARFNAIGRHYLFRILARRAPPAVDKFRVWWVPQTLDAAAMIAAAPRLEGRHDFTTFRASGCQAKSPVKTLDRFRVSVTGEEIRIEASARSFMHNQVRSMVGSLKMVGEGNGVRTISARRSRPKTVNAAGRSHRHRDSILCASITPPHKL